MLSSGSCYWVRTAAPRHFSVFGPRQADDSPFTGVMVIFDDGEQTRDFTYIDNVVAANLVALDIDAAPGFVVNNVGAGERISLNRSLKEDDAWCPWMAVSVS